MCVCQSRVVSVCVLIVENVILTITRSKSLSDIFSSSRSKNNAYAFEASGTFLQRNGSCTHTIKRPRDVNFRGYRPCIMAHATKERVGGSVT